MDKVAVRPTARLAPSQFELPPCASSKPGHIKVRLVFLTFDPKHMRSMMLQNTYGARPPYTEDVCVLIPAKKCWPELGHYAGVFSRLQFAGVLSPSAKLTHITILDEDDETLAYIVS